ncbi:hypothetical protein PCI56_12280 [Plesiomonas shigelloides subsp. oncorhynchi]|nr:hypothetical protein [Plesiomonas shigelloides]
MMSGSEDASCDATRLARLVIDNAATEVIGTEVTGVTLAAPSVADAPMPEIDAELRVSLAQLLG